MHRLTRAGAFLPALAVIAVAGCKKAETPPPAGKAPNNVTFIGSDFAFQGPDTIPAGLTRLHLIHMGPSLHHLQLVRLDSGRTLDSLMAAFKRPVPPGWVRFIGGPNAAAPGDTSMAVMQLEAGHYAVICMIPDAAGVPHAVKGMVKALEITPNTDTFATLTADLDIHLVDYDFRTSTPFVAGRRRVKIINDGPQVHEMVFVKLDSGATAAQFAHWAVSGMHGKPPGHPVGGVTGLPVGGWAFVPIRFTPGDYALLCFVPDSKDGKSHIEHGMVKQIHIG